MQKRASILRVQYERRSRELAEVEGIPWPLPAHEYCEADLALRKMPALGPVVGVFSPSLGLVTGVAA